MHPYIAAVPEPKRSELAELDALVRRTVPSFQPYMARDEDRRRDREQVSDREVDH